MRILGASASEAEQAGQEGPFEGTSTDKLHRLMQDRHASHLMQARARQLDSCHTLLLKRLLSLPLDSCDAHACAQCAQITQPSCPASTCSRKHRPLDQLWLRLDLCVKVVVRVASPQLRAGMVSMGLRGAFSALSKHPTANFVVQALLSSSSSPAEVRMICTCVWQDSLTVQVQQSVDHCSPLHPLCAPTAMRRRLHSSSRVETALEPRSA